MVGMHKHLHVLVLSKVECGCAVYCLRLSLSKVAHHQAQSLLVGLSKLRLRGVGDSRDAWRHDVVDRAALIVFFDVDGADLYGAAVRRACELLVIQSPLASYQVERSESQHDRLLELSEEHSHEADAREIAYSSHALIILRQGNAELIPLDGLFLAVAQ